jgi:hypothetical protein
VFRGQVIGPDKQPTAGARIYVVADVWSTPTESGKSGPDGRYRIDVPEEKFGRNIIMGYGVPSMQATVIVTADGLGPDWENLQAEQRDGKVALRAEYVHDFHLVADRPIDGRIVANDGRPIAAAKVEVESLFAPAHRHWEPVLATLRAGNTSELYTYAPDKWSSPINRSATAVISPAVTDEQGRFRLPGAGVDRRVNLRVTGPGVLPTTVIVLNRDDVTDLTSALRTKFPRSRAPNGFLAVPKSAASGSPGVLVYGPTPTIDVDPARTVSGVVRDAKTGKPVPRVHLGVSSRVSMGGSEQINADTEGRYRGLRWDDASEIWVSAMFFSPEKHLAATRKFTGGQSLGEIVANFDLQRGIVLTGRVLETGTDKAIVAAPRDECGVPGALLAGWVEYYPLSANAALRGSATGMYFEGPPDGAQRASVTDIQGNGRYRLVIPPGPGVLLVKAQPGLPMFGTATPLWNEKQGFHRLFPYAPLTGRPADKDDGAPPSPKDAPNALPGFGGPIPLTSYHAYHVINPEADLETMNLDLFVPRAPSRSLRFVDPDGHSVKEVTVLGLLGNDLPAVALEGAEGEICALEPSSSRTITALSADGRFAARVAFGASDLIANKGDRMTIRMHKAGTVSGRLVRRDHRQPLVGKVASLSYRAADDSGLDRVPKPTAQFQTDADGRFVIRGLVPGLAASITFRDTVPQGQPVTEALATYSPAPLQNLVLHVGEARDLGDVAIRGTTR